MGEGLFISPFYRWRLLREVILLLDPSCPGSHALEGFGGKKIEWFLFVSSTNQRPSMRHEVPATKGMCPLGAGLPLLDHTVGTQSSGIFSQMAHVYCQGLSGHLLPSTFLPVWHS